MAIKVRSVVCGSVSFQRSLHRHARARPPAWLNFTQRLFSPRKIRFAFLYVFPLSLSRFSSLSVDSRRPLDPSRGGELSSNGTFARERFPYAQAIDGHLWKNRVNYLQKTSPDLLDPFHRVHRSSFPASLRRKRVKTKGSLRLDQREFYIIRELEISKYASEKREMGTRKMRGKLYRYVKMRILRDLFILRDGLDLEI